MIAGKPTKFDGLLLETIKFVKRVSDVYVSDEVEDFFLRVLDVPNRGRFCTAL